MIIFESFALGAVCWLATMIVVESELFRPLRDWIGEQENKAKISIAEYQINRPGRAMRYDVWRLAFWHKLRYLIGCHLCSGVWLGLIIAALTPWVTPVATAGAGTVLNGLLYKAIGHVLLIWQRYMEARTNA